MDPLAVVASVGIALPQGGIAQRSLFSQCALVHTNRGCEVRRL